jgi:putative ABC transport system permease protein
MPRSASSVLLRAPGIKAMGFSPPQVVAAYVLQMAVPAVTGCAVGATAGILLAVPMLGRTAQVYGVGRLAVPIWVDLAVPLGMLGLVVVTVSAIALRAGRMSSVQAIATGRAPRPRHGYGVLRLLGRDPLARLVPRPVTMAWPARSRGPHGPWSPWPRSCAVSPR